MVTWQLKEKLQQVLAKERGAMVFAPGSRQSFALAYPNTYHVGMSNLGLQIIYQQINNRIDTCCERVFLPDKKTEEEYVRTNTPLMTLETQRQLYDFPLIGFAVSFEMDYFHILKMLELGKIPLRAADRGENDPIIIIGGPCATFNPEPLADFIDLAVIGEGEEVIHQLLDTYYHCREKGLSRADFLLAAAQVAGIYVPSLFLSVYNPDWTLQQLTTPEASGKRVKRRWIKELDQFAGQTVIVTPDTEFSGMFLLEVSRGCGRHCRFCMAGYCFLKPRVRSLDYLQQAIMSGVMLQNKIGLVGAAISDYPAIDQLCQYILAKGLKMSVASLRADSLTPILAQALAASGHKTITLAPEAGSTRLRRVLNKGITDVDLMNAVKLAVSAGIPNLKIYIMVGLPGETEEDVAAIVTMARMLKTQMKDRGSKGRLTLSMNPFIPKPFTPFQWVPMAAASLVETRLKYVQRMLKGDKGVEVMVESTKEAYIQGVLARGDRRLGAVLLAAHSRGGSKNWKQSMKELGIDEEFYLYRQREVTEILPWQHLDMGFDQGYLAQEYLSGQQEQLTPGCFPTCVRCGICREDKDAK